MNHLVNYTFHFHYFCLEFVENSYQMHSSCAVRCFIAHVCAMNSCLYGFYLSGNLFALSGLIMNSVSLSVHFYDQGMIKKYMIRHLCNKLSDGIIY